MRKPSSTIAALALALAGAALFAVPAGAEKTPDGATDDVVMAACPSGMRCGSYSIGGLGSRKQQVRNAGGNVLDLAVAMLETDRMNTNYPYGDNKRDDAANFGIFKQNWYMLRSKCDRFRGQSTSQWNNGAALNSNLTADISCLHQSQNAYGMTVWFGGHRNGQTGINNPSTGDINGGEILTSAPVRPDSEPLALAVALQAALPEFPALSEAERTLLAEWLTRAVADLQDRPPRQG